MQLFTYEKSFYIFNIILFLTFCLIANVNYNFLILYYFLYCFFHFLLIYLGVYHYGKILYLFYFIYGLILDLIWFDEIGPHLIVFMISLLILRFTLRHLYQLNSSKIYILLLFSQLVMIILESFLSSILFNYQLDYLIMLKIISISIILSYPIFLTLNKIDKIR